MNDIKNNLIGKFTKEKKLQPGGKLAKNFIFFVLSFHDLKIQWKHYFHGSLLAQLLLFEKIIFWRRSKNRLYIYSPFIRTPK